MIFIKSERKSGAYLYYMRGRAINYKIIVINKMKNKKLTLAVLGLVLSGGLMFSAQDVFAYKGDVNIKGPNYSPERHDAMTKAFATKDYATWKNLMQGKGRVTQVVNKDNFAKFVEARNLSLQGKKAESEKIRKELGLGQQNGTGRLGGQGLKGANRNRR